MLNLLTFFIGIVTIFLLARYNKSNKLFWLFVISMMTGFAGGTIASRLCDGSKKDCVDSVSSDVTNTIHGTCAFFAQASDIVDVPQKNETSTVYSFMDTHLSTSELQPVLNPEDCGLKVPLVDTS